MHWKAEFLVLKSGATEKNSENRVDFAPERSVQEITEGSREVTFWVRIWR